MYKNDNKFYFPLTLIFSLCLIISNLAEMKIINVFGIGQFGAGTIFFPLLYVINDIITEVYGFTASRRTIWYALVSSILFSVGMYCVMLLPDGQDWQEKEAFEIIFTLSPRIVFGSLVAFFVGELVNAVIIANLKVQLKGKIFPVRAILSTLIASLIESIIFSIIAFYGRVPGDELFKMTILLTLAKTLYEFLIMPISSALISYLKTSEKIDVYEKPTISAIIFPFR